MTTSRKRPVFQNTYSFQIKSLYLEPLISDHILQGAMATFEAKKKKFSDFTDFSLKSLLVRSLLDHRVRVLANLMLGVTLQWISIPSRGEKKYS